MAGKKTIMQPIDRPLSRAYLRGFTGWATASPPGLSDPTTLRLMENVFIKPDGAVAVRPALRSIFPDDVFLHTVVGGAAVGATIVGSFESFYLNDSSKAILFAVRETKSGGGKQVGFRVAKYSELTGQYTILFVDDAVDGFSVLGGAEALAFSAATTYVKYVQIDNKIFALSNADEPLRMFWVDAVKKAKPLQSVTVPNYNLVSRLSVVQPAAGWVSGAQTTIPTAPFMVAAADTLISSVADDNDYNFAYFYTFNNEIGESAPSMLTVVRTKRGWGAWKNNPADDKSSADQLVAMIPAAVWTAAQASNAVSWNLYMLSWSDQAPVPVEGVLIKTTEVGAHTIATHGWVAHTPLIEGLESTMSLPNAGNRKNYSEPSHAAQGIVAGDRLILTNDKSDAAVIRWSSNQQGDYTNFSSSKGGGFKTLTSGNLFIPACVKLWQNPQSTDTLTVLCMGVDGYNTSYYMNANSNTNGLSQSTVVMGFEETTATPGTVSPYGCEVLNNALFHPLDWMLMKSTASNYNINHKSMTDPISNKWVELRNKYSIISAQMNNLLYYIVDNPDGIDVPADCKGNEIWVCDTATDGTWSRWLIPAVSLRKIAIKGRLYMAVIKPDGIYVLDDLATMDSVNVNGLTQLTPIPWMFETNTQGANRAHDANAHFQQASAIFGNVQGKLLWGIKGYDVNGKVVDRIKQYNDLRPVDMSQRPMPYDIEDFLMVQRNMREWRFVASSVPGEMSYGQLNLVQYRYAPSTVNSGYEHGSIETFEYARSIVNDGDRNTDNGVPQPMIDTRYP